MPQVAQPIAFALSGRTCGINLWLFHQLYKNAADLFQQPFFNFFGPQPFAFIVINQAFKGRHWCTHQTQDNLSVSRATFWSKINQPTWGWISMQKTFQNALCAIKSDAKNILFWCVYLLLVKMLFLSGKLVSLHSQLTKLWGAVTPR